MIILGYDVVPLLVSGKKFPSDGSRPSSCTPVDLVHKYDVCTVSPPLLLSLTLTVIEVEHSRTDQFLQSMTGLASVAQKRPAWTAPWVRYRTRRPVSSHISDVS